MCALLLTNQRALLQDGELLRFVKNLIDTMSILRLSPRRVLLTMVRYKSLVAVIQYFRKFVNQGNEEKLVLVLPSVVILSQSFMYFPEELMID